MTKQTELHAIERIKLFGDMQHGWNGYTAPPPSRKAIDKAIEVYQKLLIKPCRVAPSVVGGIGFSFKNNKGRLYVEIYNNGEIYSIYTPKIGVKAGEEVVKENDITLLNEKIINLME